MERLTTNKSVADMSMVELAHNSCYVDSEGNARYRDYEMEMDARDFARNLMVTLTKDELSVDDAEFDEEILDNLRIDPFSDVRGLIALFYRNMWAMAGLREKLKRYEDAEEQGLLVRLPCKVGDSVCVIVEKNISKQKIQRVTFGSEGKIEFCTRKRGFALFDIGKTVFLTREEAEAKLKEMRDEQ